MQPRFVFVSSINGKISIHAPYKGCNENLFEAFLMARKFQSMHPIKDATKLERGDIYDENISIHAPYKGCNRAF